MVFNKSEAVMNANSVLYVKQSPPAEALQAEGSGGSGGLGAGAIAGAPICAWEHAGAGNGPAGEGYLCSSTGPMLGVTRSAPASVQ